ncbi:MAG: ADP-ribosylglycohydrolase family protein [Chitinophagales bacterium]
MRHIAKDLLLGLSVADAVGVPVEFQSRATLQAKPVIDMQGYGTYNQPPGTWSDDSSLAFCLADSLCKGYDLKDIAFKFIQWGAAQIWTPHGRVFDIGRQTGESIDTLSYLFRKGRTNELTSLYTDNERANGNGALMRILPLVLLTRQIKQMTKKFQLIREVSALTHGHIRSAIACLLYLRIAELLIEDMDKMDAYVQAKWEVMDFLVRQKIAKGEQELFSNLFIGNIAHLKMSEISSSGYVMHSIEASLWCLLNENSYEAIVLKAVNLGEDTDTTAAIAGGLAGLCYGSEQIPQNWVNQLVRKNDIFNLAAQLDKIYSS